MGKLKEWKGNIKKKESGSAILMVLMISTILIILSAVVSSSLVFTTRGNTLSKYKSDYTYAAEGGIEYGIERFTESGPFTGSYDPATGVDGRVKLDFLGNTSATDEKEIYEVRVECKGSGTDYELISTVYNKDKKQLAKVTLPLKGKIGISKILEYTICTANDIDITSPTLTFSPSKVAYNPFDGGDKQITAGTKVDACEEAVKVEKSEFSSYVNINPNDITYSSFDKLVEDALKLTNPDPLIAASSNFEFMTDTKNSPSDGMLNNGLGYYKIDNINLILVSGRNLNIIGDSQSNLTNTVIISDGTVNVSCDSMFLSRSTIYSNNVNMNLTGSLTMQRSPLYDGSTVPNDVNQSNGQPPNFNVNSTDIIKIDELLSKYMSSYGASSDISGKPDINYGNVVYEY
ncbi:MAG: hypothetical protein RR585_05710 [Coprobacillus sp.]